MKDEFARRSENQSGQRFLNGSAPRLIRHAASCKTAGGESIALPAGKDQKPFRGMGQSPMHFARAARVPKSLQISLQVLTCHASLLWHIPSRLASRRAAIALGMAVSCVQCNPVKLPFAAPPAAEVHQGGDAALSCRPCLIACNSRQIDEQELGA